MDPKRLLQLSAVAGAGLVVFGGIMWYRQRKTNQLSTDGLGRRMLGYVAEAPVISSYSDGNMKTEIRSDPDMPIEQRLATIQRKVRESIQDPEMRKLALAVTARCTERDKVCEAKAIYKAVKARVRYTGDIAPVMWENGEAEGVDLYQSARRTWEFKGGDCLPLSTLVLRDDFEIVPILALDPGDRIFDGENGWVEVQDRWLTGEKELLSFQLSNGCDLRCSKNHRLFRSVNGRVEEVRADQVAVGDDLLPGNRIPTSGPGIVWPDVASSLASDELAWLLGIYVADGWSEEYRSSISGQDGKPKEAQKRRVEGLMQRLNVATRWHRKYLAINNSELARFFSEAGDKVYNKHLPSLALSSESDVKALLEGLAADADKRNGVFGTTSPKLALQLRVLHRMLGISTHVTRVDDHGGLGTHPIYRVTPRRESQRKDLMFNHVRAIKDAGSALCADLTVVGGKLWLPESDMVVHNCDDQSILNATLLSLNGIPAILRVSTETPNGGNDSWSHIYAGASIDGRFYALDTTLPGRFRFGVEAPNAAFRDFVA